MYVGNTYCYKGMRGAQRQGVAWVAIDKRDPWQAAKIAIPRSYLARCQICPA